MGWNFGLGDACLTTTQSDCNAQGGIFRGEDEDCDTDNDQDAVADACDNCPQVANADQADADDDTVGDACDECAGTPTGANGVVDARGCPGAIIYVDAGATAGANDGTGWADAFVDLQSALDLAVPGHEIWVAAGIYAPSLRTDADDPRTATFPLASGVAIYGAFPPGGGTFADRDPATHVTTLNGDIGTSGDNTDNSYHVVTGSNTDADAVLDGFTIIAGHADGPYPDVFGAGMFISAGSPTVANCTFSGNSAGEGGGMYINVGSPMIAGCTFSANSAGGDGGGMENLGGSPTLINCTFSGNSAQYGGGMDDLGSGSTLTNCTFSRNSAALEGGGLSDFSFGELTVTNCIFWENSDIGGMDESAQIFAGSTPVVTFSCIQDGIPGDGVVPFDGAVNRNTDEDPHFRNPGEGDHHLQAPSSGINTGNNDADVDANTPGVQPLPATDLDGAARIKACVVDMGAYEADVATGGPDPTAGVILVDASAPDDGDGLTWNTAFNDLQQALDAAAGAAGAITEIWVGPGVYLPSKRTKPDDPRSATFQLLDGVALYGGLHCSDSQLAQRDVDPTTNGVVLSGDVAGDDVGAWNDPSRGENCYHVVTGSGTDATAVLDGFTVTGGNANVMYTADANGAGMLNDAGSPTVANCRFLANVARGGGVGMYNYGASSPAVTDCIFELNLGMTVYPIVA